MQPITEYEDEYQITSTGDVYRVGKNKPLVPSVNPQNGYLYVALWKRGKGKTFSVHRLVALHFIPNPENKPNINHIDSDRQNACDSNLEWCTQAENIQHGYDYGCMSQEHRRKFNAFELDIHLTSFLSGITITQLANVIGCGLSNLSIDLKKTAKKGGRLCEYAAELKTQKNSRNAAVAVKQRKAINMHDLDGRYLKTFTSLQAAAKHLGKKSTGTISNALNPTKNQKKGYGYLWTYA